VLNLLTQYLKRSVGSGGLFTDITKGISSGCPLSPIISSFYLVELDKEMEGKPVYYRRYMDDIIVLSTSRWKLRKAIKTVNQHFEKLKLRQHPDKTTIGRIKNGFDFLGYQFGQEKSQFQKEQYKITYVD
jgi:RNA-directed DNA polymerase